ncbi:dynein regulatory complex subunit 5 [Halictus rubicundus]|uniref:dynein regulatory complex subunit 5 n=1 Tax=Halictus rubicundus TaxID=77578 RepID=UPI00403664A3
MKIPHSVPKNAFEVYRCSHDTTRLSSEVDRTLCSEDPLWDENRIPSLRRLALLAIAVAWEDNPILDELPTCEDRNELIELLPVDLPLELAITKIEDEHYWERCSRNKWETNELALHGNSWRQRYCEGVFCEYLESLEPSFFETQRDECERMISLVRSYVHAIRIRSLRPTRKEKSLDEGDPCHAEEDIVHHVPMAVILPLLPELVEIRINFGVIYMNDGFEWRDFQFSVEDCQGLGQGALSCSKLNKFTVSRSNLDQPRVAALLQGLVEHQNITEIDFSHCKLGDKGVFAVGEFLSTHNAKVMRLANNDIGPKGVSGLVHGMLKRKQQPVLEHLDLRLNPLLDEGATHLCAYLLRTDSLEILNASGCGIEAAGGAAFAEVLTSGCNLKTLSLDLSNNDFGQPVGEIFEDALKNIPFIVRFDARMCNFSAQSEYSIYESVLWNRKVIKAKARRIHENLVY